MNRWMISLVVIAGLIAGGGCKRATEKLAEKAMEKAIEHKSGGKADVTIKDGSVSVKTDEGEYISSTGEGAQLPPDFPADVYVPAEAKLIATVKVPEGFALTLQSPRTADQLAAECGARMKAAGWEEKTAVVMAENLMFNYGRESDSRTATYMIARGSDGAQMQITALHR